jgi:hypothetical protein
MRGKAQSARKLSKAKRFKRKTIFRIVRRNFHFSGVQSTKNVKITADLHLFVV